MFLISLFISTLIVMSSTTWLGVWLGLEINLLAMIPLMENSNNMLKTEASVKYFTTQVVASSLILLSIMMMTKTYSLTSSLIIMTAIFIKMGAAPFHFWFPSVMEGLSWNNAFIMMTWQKLAPMSIISLINPNIMMMIMIIILSMMVSGIMGINQTSLRKIMAFSSINHIGWMLAATMSSSSMWMFYFLIYMMINANLVWMFNTYKIFQFKQLMIKMDSHLKLFLILNFMSIAGIPPFLGFLPKWMVIQAMSEMYMYLMYIMSVMTLIPVFFYIRMAFTGLMIIQDNLKKESYFMKWTIACSNIMSIMGLFTMTLWFNMN
uniref:NADH-ubiquinone oxidoreductase chain 2 n=1 Tax=Histeroidea sp. 3 KM-2017 TaxID=2219436 RepID=A0A346RIE4_9COLE|nr:NADH dehydrogenase subunit 2 [Histeroidea sp. 3 KM-2017]